MYLWWYDVATGNAVTTGTGALYFATVSTDADCMIKSFRGPRMQCAVIAWEDGYLHTLCGVTRSICYGSLLLLDSHPSYCDYVHPYILGYLAKDREANGTFLPFSIQCELFHYKEVIPYTDKYRVKNCCYLIEVVLIPIFINLLWLQTRLYADFIFNHLSITVNNWLDGIWWIASG